MVKTNRKHDAVERSIRDIERQGSGMARIAHFFAVLLVVLFSLGSLVSLSGDSLTAVLAQWHATHALNIPAAISIAVSTLLVVAMDVGMLYSALMLRLLATRRAAKAEKRVHCTVMFGVALLESATYAYMGAVYEHPQDIVAWLLILSRALAAPLLSIYLSMARPLPVTSRDILAQAELASGMGVLRDVVRHASDETAALSDKVALYGASALMAPEDRARLDAMLTVVQRQIQPVMVREAVPQVVPVSQPLPDGKLLAPVNLNEVLYTGNPPETAKQRHKRPTSLAAKRTSREAVLTLTDPDATPRQRKAETPEARCRKLLKKNPALSKKELARLAGVAESTAARWKRVVSAELAEAAAQIEA